MLELAEGFDLGAAGPEVVADSDAFFLPRAGFGRAANSGPSREVWRTKEEKDQKHSVPIAEQLVDWQHVDVREMRS